MGAALGAAIVRSMTDPQQRQQQGRIPDDGQSQAARQALENWANRGDGSSRQDRGAPRSYAPRSAVDQLNQWANEAPEESTGDFARETRSEDLRDTPDDSKSKPKGEPKRNAPQNTAQSSVARAIPKECILAIDLNGQQFYECIPLPSEHRQTYCLEVRNSRQEEVPCNTSSP